MMALAQKHRKIFLMIHWCKCIFYICSQLSTEVTGRNQMLNKHCVKPVLNWTVFKLFIVALHCPILFLRYNRDIFSQFNWINECWLTYWLKVCYLWCLYSIAFCVVGEIRWVVLASVSVCGYLNVVCVETDTFLFANARWWNASQGSHSLDSALMRAAMHTAQQDGK